MDKVIFWDFDGTLGGRIDGLVGRAWSSSMVEAIEQIYGRSDFTMEDIAPLITTGFPWHESEKPHVELNDPERWWERMRAVMARIFVRLGFAEGQAEQLARAAQGRFVDLDTWELYDDVLPVLARMKEEGWRQIIVSNHVPELGLIAEHLGVTPYIEYIVNSANVGYEKPNPAIFRVAQKLAGDVRELWMVGDNVVADVLGAEAAGIDAILIRNRDTRARYQADDAYGVMEFLLKGAGRS